MSATIVLKGAHVIDPSQGIDRIADVLVVDGKIGAVGDVAVPPGAEVIDLAGHYISPGWIDLHVHAYGTLGFANPDSIGVYQGVTSFVEAGGPGIGTIDEFMVLLKDRTVTDLYVGPYIRPLGIIGLNFIEGDIRSLDTIPVNRWMEFAKEHRDMFRYLKIGAFESYGTGPLRMGKGLAETLGVPMYVHVGEIYEKPNTAPSMDVFRIAERGDMITHIYHGNGGNILEADGKVMPVIREAEQRGVLFDVGFGGYNFSWKVAEAGYAQGIVPHIISSDVQQFNVLGPAFSLANVMGVCAHLGMSIHDVVQRVTEAPAKALSLTDRAGSLRPGMPADITVFRVESGEFELVDCVRQKRKANQRFMPSMVFKKGRRIDCDMSLCQDERNWFLQIADDHVPVAAANFSSRQLAFLADFAEAIARIDWEMYAPERLNLNKALELQAAFHAVRARHALGLKDALMAVFDCYLDSPFTMQVGLFILRLDRLFAIERMRSVAKAALVH